MNYFGWAWQFEWHDDTAKCKECSKMFNPEELQELHDFLIELYDHWGECGD